MSATPEQALDLAEHVSELLARNPGFDRAALTAAATDLRLDRRLARVLEDLDNP